MSDDSPSLALTTIHVRKAVSGDRDSLGWIIERISPLLLLKARSLLRHPALRGRDPHDFVHEAWLTALPRLTDLQPRPDGRLTPVVVRFMGTTLHYKCLDEIKRRARAAGPDAAEIAIADGAVSLVSGLIRAEAVGQVVDELQKLPRTEREIFLLRAVDELGFPEIVRCLELDVSPDSVRHLYNRLLTELHARLPTWIAHELD